MALCFTPIFNKIFPVIYLQKFNTFVLDERVLALGRLLRRNILVFPDEQLGEEENNNNVANRFHAYMNYTLWRHGRFSSEVRIPILACAVWKISDKFPHPYEQFIGCKPSV
ncbi:hypothetical protein DPMN_070636 [Dreissena polymorpha]|uniref:P2X purinoreceptor 7 intracellular domain-containing protein n=1 Tax=Dreissena polymorpha TaxID=45954 RepID=A0A9D4BP34_DREPO|nr:hypothetical protein DPMN_070636 [Dreissena polymorpha]